MTVQFLICEKSINHLSILLPDLHLSVLSDIFFFSSRRRHTRFSRDWSSDVCSSDLDVCFADLNGERAAEVAIANKQRAEDNGAKVMAVEVDVTNREQVRRMKIGRASCRERV